MSYYGNAMSIFFGVCVENGTDPLFMNRIKVKIFGVHDNIENEFLPFAQISMPCTGGGTSGVGETPRIEQGAHVMGCFLDDGKQIPIVTGVVAHYGIPTNEQRSLLSTSKEANVTTIAPITVSLRPTFHSLVKHKDKDNVKDAWEFFSTAPGLYNSYKNHHIAGMIGNFIEESRFAGIEMNPLATANEAAIPNISGGDFREDKLRYRAFGIAQWGIDRKLELQKYAKDQKVSEEDLITQLRFVDWELKNYSFLRGSFFMTNTVLEATMMFMRLYERPGFEKKVKSINVNNGVFGWPRRYWNLRFGEEKRIKNANKIYNQYTQVTPTITVVSPDNRP